MLLGDRCTRRCGYCSVSTARPLPPDPEEPGRVAAAAARMKLRYVVLTSVNRDDLPDGGAAHFAATVRAVRAALPRAAVEVLTPDFKGDREALAALLDAAPEVFNHNVETVPRLFRSVRGPKSDYRWTLETFRRVRARDPQIRTKSGLMLGLGETVEELLDLLADLLEAGCEMLTLGQYLQPAKHCLAVARYVTPEEFDHLGELARQMGFKQVASGPFVRSSYHARSMLAV
jgi:lipoic acid synthetase